MKIRRAKKATGKEGVEASATKQSPKKRPFSDMEGEHEDRDVQAAWLDPDAMSLDCGICFMPFEAEVFMCNNGHAACAKCCLHMNRKCWVCREAIGDVRCRPLESILAEINTYCKFRKYGCEEILKYVEKRKHEESCPCEPFVCPFGDCSYLGTVVGLYDHVLDEHADMVVSSVSYLQTAQVPVHRSEPFCLFFTRYRTSIRRVFLLLNGGNVLGGRSLSLVCLGPRPEGDAAGIKYKMEVRCSDGSTYSLAAAAAPCIRRLELFDAKKFLFVPDADWGPSSTVSVSIRIG